MKIKPNLFQRSSKFALVSPFAVVLIGASTLHLQAATWLNSGTTDWNTASNWNPSGVPTGQNAVINSDTGNIATITVNPSGTPNDVIVGDGGGTNGLVNHTGGLLTMNYWFKVGHNGGTGIYNLGVTGGAGFYTGLSQGSGSITVGTNGQLRLGGDGSGGGNGTLNVHTSETITVNGGDIAVGKNGSGTLNMDSGTIDRINGGTFIVGEDSGHTGTVQISDGTVNNTGEMWIGNNSGGDGTMTLSGGAINQDSWFSIGRNGATGVLNVNDGLLTKTATNSQFVVGDGSFANSSGTLIQTGGAIDLRSQLWIGKGFNAGPGSLATGTATITGGTVQVDSWLAIGRDGATGTLTINGTGSVTQGSPGDPFSNLELTNQSAGSATINLDGGTLTAMGIQKSGASGSTSTFNFNGGTLRAGRDNTAFMQGLATARVRDDGAIIDTQAFSVTIAQNLFRSGDFGDVGTGILRKTGVGTLTLSGTGDNSGVRVRVEDGTLVLAKTSSGSVHAVGTDGGTDFALQITSGTAKLGGTNGDQIYQNSAVDMTGGSFDLAGFSEGFDGLSGIAGIVTNSTAATTSTLTLGQNNSSGSPVFDGLIENGSGTVALTKTGSGTQTLNGANTFSGGASINAGTLAIGHNTALGSATVAMSDGATLANNSTSPLTLANAFSLSGSTNGVTFTGSQDLTLTGGFSGGSGVKVTKTGASVLTLSADNTGSLGANANWKITGGTYDSLTGLYDNVLAINSGRALGITTGNFLNLDGGTLRFTVNGGTGYFSARTINVLAGGGAIDDDGFAFGEASGGGVVNPGISITSGATLNLVSSNKLVLSGVLSGSNGAVSKFGTGTAILSGTNNYTGATTINSGTLVINGYISGSLVTTVNDGATLAGTGTVGPVTTLGTTSVIAPGSAGIGTLHTGTTTLTGVLDTELDASTSDLLNVTGNLTVTGATVAFTTLGTPTASKYVIAKYTGTLTGTLASTTVPSGYQLNHNTAAKEIQLLKLSFSGFMEQFPGLRAADKLPGADPDHDGVSNLVEYALNNFDPTTSNAAPGTLTGYVLSFTKRPLAVSNNDITYAIEESTTLGVAPSPWTVVNPYLLNNSTTISYELPTGQPTEFVRLKVSQN